MDIHRLMQESNRKDFTAFITRMLEAFKINVQILERRLEDEQKFTGNAVREMDARLNLYIGRIERLEQIQRTIIDGEQEDAEAAREAEKERQDPGALKGT